jgi:hypothetical protein
LSNDPIPRGMSRLLVDSVARDVGWSNQAVTAVIYAPPQPSGVRIVAPPKQWSLARANYNSVPAVTEAVEVLAVVCDLCARVFFLFRKLRELGIKRECCFLRVWDAPLYIYMHIHIYI